MSYVHNATDVAQERSWTKGLESTRAVLFIIDEKVVTLKMKEAEKKNEKKKSKQDNIENEMRVLILQIRTHFPSLDGVLKVLGLEGGRLNDCWIDFKNAMAGQFSDIDPDKVFIKFKAFLVVMAQI
jgi:hypothetical protein